MWIVILSTVALVLAWLGQGALAALLVCAIAAIAYDAAQRSYCSSCSRPYAVFTVRGRHLGYRRVCRRCFRQHLQLEENVWP